MQGNPESDQRLDVAERRHPVLALVRLAGETLDVGAPLNVMSPAPKSQDTKSGDVGSAKIITSKDKVCFRRLGPK